MSFTYGSLFSGIGGIDLGLDRAGMSCAWQVEINEYASKVLKKQWKRIARFRDIRTVEFRQLARPDVIGGGFPCQDVSNAGTKRGLDGERSGLWSQFYRAICELQPRFVLVENVAALLVRGFDRVLRDLAAIRYDAEWQVLSAAAFGAPHIRERVFIVAYPASQQNRRIRQPWIQSDFRASDNELAYSISKALQRGGEQRGIQTAPQEWTPAIFERRGRTRITRSDWWQSEPGIRRVAHGIPHRVDRLRGLGNAVVPQVAEYVGRCILASIEQEATA